MSDAYKQKKVAQRLYMAEQYLEEFGCLPLHLARWLLDEYKALKSGQAGAPQLLVEE